MSEEKSDSTTREQALRVARMLGCQGAHETDKGWMPCGSHEEYGAIKKGKEEYLKFLASKKKKPLPKMVQRTKRLETKSDAYYESRSDALSISRARGCGGVRTVMLAGKKYYAPCDHKPRKGWEQLNEKPITGIATLPGGGLVTGSFSGKALGTLVRPIGGVSEIDGDGDGFTSNIRGEDKVPVVAKNVLEQIKKIGPEGVEMQTAQRIQGFSREIDEKDFSEVVAVDPIKREKIASQYDRMPVLDEKAKKSYDQLAKILDNQYSALVAMGIRFEFVDEDPYASFYEMREDFLRNRRLKVMRTSVTGSHPYWNDATNDKFRAVHDVLGHLATGRGFDRHGEEAAYQAHKLTMPAEVHGALAMETRGQNSFLIERGDFPPQKAGILPDDMIKKIFEYLQTKQDKIFTSDDDNLFAIGGSHHVSGGRHFGKNKINKKSEEKGFVNFVSRSTDPDTFSDPESARIRARNLGCIGIRRYTARDGKLVWLPCTNVSDYNRVAGIRGDNSPRNNPRRQGSAFRKKVLGTPIGAKPSGENVDGDGDGFTTGGIIGGEDKIPVTPKSVLRTLQEKFKNGPLKFIGGMESGRNIPRVFSDKESRERYGNTRLAMQDFFQKKYGIKLEFPQETKEQKTARLKKIKEDVRTENPDMSEADLNKRAKKVNQIINERVALAKELWKYLENPNAKETPKDYSLRTQTYPRFYEQADNMLAEIHGSMQALEDLFSNANLSEEDKSKLSVQLKLQDFDNPGLDVEGYADVKRDKDQKAIISMNVMFKAWAFTIDGDEDQRQLAYDNTGALQLGEIPAQVGTRFEAPLAGGENRKEVIQDLRRALEKMRDGEFFRRKGYATTVHEFAHVLDALAYENLEKWIAQNPDDTEARERLAKMKFLEEMSNVSRANYLSVALMVSMQENNPQISKYAALSFPERFAEQFTAWFLFSKAKGLFGDEEMRKRNADDKAEEVLGLHLGMHLKQIPIVPKIEKTSSYFQKIMRRRHPVGQFIFGGLSNLKKKALGATLLAKPNADFVDGDGDGFTTGGIVGGEDKIPVVPKAIQKVVGFIGKLKNKLGSDGSIHPKALELEIRDESEDLIDKKSRNAGVAAKKLVAKNIAEAMSDVTTEEIANTILFLHDIENGKTAEQMDSILYIIDQEDEIKFAISESGVLTPDITRLTESEYVEKEIARLIRANPEAMARIENGKTMEEFKRQELSNEYKHLKATATFYTHPSPEAEKALKEVAVRHLVSAWATSSNNNYPLSLAMQDAAQKLFKTDWAVSWTDNEAKRSPIYTPSTEHSDNKVLRSFLLAQYNATQQYFASKGIKKVTLFRGMGSMPMVFDVDSPSESQTAELLMRPLSAWSTNFSEANAFAVREGKDGILIKATFDVKDILSIPLTGVGCSEEFEVVVKSGTANGEIREAQSMIFAGEEERRELLTKFRDWAYSGQTGEAPQLSTTFSWERPKGSDPTEGNYMSVYGNIKVPMKLPEALIPKKIPLEETVKP